ncbi:MAG: leucyl aminopeptidase [Gammaproteobacteria bacterium]|nr:leucyl aminopeptidase [Gammaproteobacteria bacterium]
MDFLSKKAQIGTIKTDALILAVYEGSTLGSAAQAVDAASGGQIAAILKHGDITGKPGETLLLPAVQGVHAKRILLAGFGKQGETSDSQFRKSISAALNAVKGTVAKDAALDLVELTVKNRDSAWIARQIVELGEASTYTFDQYKSKDNQKKVHLKKLTLLNADSAADKALSVGQAIAGGMSYTKDLGNLPPNVCTPTYLADEAKKLAKSVEKMTLKVIDEKEMKELGMGALLSVSAGSVQPAKLIIMDYRGGKKNEKPHIIVGKGITFDTGGISLKPGPDMDQMKYDMCGAASVLGTMKAITDMKLPLNVIGVITSAENMPGGKASRPGDIVTTMSGQTVEILNTDAEGRLVLCDALTYIERYEPASVVDIATLTGAIIVSLGVHATGMFSNNDGVVDQLKQAGDYTQDRVWHMPLWEDYQSQLDSPFADMANIGGPKAGSITAACFLSRYTKKYPWAHLDIAGTSFLGQPKGATGRPVPLLSEYLISQIRKK